MMPRMARMFGATMAILTASGVACRASAVSIATITDDQLASIDRNRVRADSAAVAGATPAFIVEPPNASIWTFRMRQPVAIAAMPRGCGVVVGDSDDDAVHWFASAPGGYVTSFYLGGRDSAIVGRMGGLDVAADGSVLVGDAGRGAVAIVSTRGEVRSLRLHLPDSSAPLGRVARDAAGRLYEKSKPLGTADSSLIRVWNRDGQRQGGIGTFRNFGDDRISHALNDGALAIRGDTLWFARFSDGRILGFPLRSRARLPARTVELPLYFEMEKPVAATLLDKSDPRSQGQLSAQAQRHVSALALDNSGNFFVAQYVNGTTQVLVGLTRDGRTRIAMRVHGQIRALAATTTSVYVLEALRPTAVGLRGNVRMAVYPNPFAARARLRTASGEEPPRTRCLRWR